MLERIIIGVVIGFVSGFFFPTNKDKNDKSEVILLLFIIMIVSIGFIGSSFAYGTLYGVMAISEIVIGFGIASSLPKKI